MTEPIPDRKQAISILRTMLVRQTSDAELKKYCFQLSKTKKGFRVIALEAASIKSGFEKPVYDKGYIVNPTDATIGEEIPVGNIFLDEKTLMYKWHNSF